MKHAKKWDYTERMYEDIEIDDGCKAYSDDMNEIVICPGCGKGFRFGSGYTSHEIQTPVGFGYVVCKDCYLQELSRRERYKV